MRHIIATSVLVVTLFVCRAECGGEVERLRQLVQQKDATIAEQENTVQQKDMTIAEQAHNVTTLMTQLAGHASVVEQKDDTIADKEKAITSLEFNVMLTSFTVASLRAQLRETVALLTRKNGRVDALTDDIAQLHEHHRVNHSVGAAVFTALVVCVAALFVSLRNMIKAKDATIAQLEVQVAPTADAAVAYPQAAVSAATDPLHHADPENADVVLVSLPPGE